MFNRKTYVLCCHGCGKIHTVESEFLSSPSAIQLIHDGTRWNIPMWGCSDCMSDPSKPIRKAFQNGMTPESMARAQAEFTEKFSSLPLSR